MIKIRRIMDREIRTVRALTVRLESGSFFIRPNRAVAMLIAMANSRMRMIALNTMSTVP
jgi:hypothetical protein